MHGGSLRNRQQTDSSLVRLGLEVNVDSCNACVPGGKRVRRAVGHGGRAGVSSGVVGPAGAGAAFAFVHGGHSGDRNRAALFDQVGR